MSNQTFGIIVGAFLGITLLVFTNLPAIHHFFEKKPKENSQPDNPTK